MGYLEIIGTVVAIVATLVGGIWFVVQKMQKLAINDYRMGKMERDVVGLKADVSDLKIEVCGIKKTLGDAMFSLNELSKWAMKIDNALIDTIVRKASPYKMTDEGERLYRKSKADVALRNMKDRLLSAMDEKKPRTEYDVEQAAIDVLLSHTGDEDMDEVKRFVYYSPDRYKDEVSGVEVRFDFFSIVRLMSIALRDIYLDTRSFSPKAC